MVNNYTISFEPRSCDTYSETSGVLIVGAKDNLLARKDDIEAIRKKIGHEETDGQFLSKLEGLEPNDHINLYYSRFQVSTLPLKGTRHNAPMLPHALSKIVKSSLLKCAIRYITIVCERNHAFALGCAVGRVFPLYDKKTGSTNVTNINVNFLFVGENSNPITLAECRCISSAVESIRLAAKIVDTPCNEMHTDAFIEEAKRVADELKVEIMVVQGEELVTRGFGGIYGVGKAAVHQPALVVLSHKPNNAKKNIVWCGKGIVYDTGGLSIKTRLGMVGMKRDCGGAAGILGAFRSAVQMGFKENLHAVLCLAENAVGEKSARPDDIHTLYSGLTVEINNTDAEGRLVLGDGVAFAKKDLKADVIVDMATLTGAQGIATGQYHASILTNNEQWEVSCIEAGKMSGDLCFPVPYTPEFHFKEFDSEIADMKNSVKSRTNAQVSCAGLFIGSHIGFDYPGVWLHVDMAAPVYTENERATGYGVALLTTLFGKFSGNEILQNIAPKNM